MILKEKSKIVIIGGGISGITLAENLRSARQDLEITIIEQENNPLYSKVLLPHFIDGRIPLEKVFLKNFEWYQKNNLEFLCGTFAEKIDAQNQFVLTSDQREIPYDKLILCTGGDVRLIDSNARGVTYLRTLDDAHQIISLINETKQKDNSAVVYGGGFIALEFINAFKKHNLQTTLAFRGQGFWTQTLKPELSAILENELAKNEIPILKEVSLDLKDQTELSEIYFSNGQTIQSSLLGIGIGITPDFSFLKETGLQTNKGVITDEYFSTNLPNIYCIGDLAEFYDSITNRHLITGNWLSAILQARQLAKNFLTEKSPFSAVTSYATKLLNLNLVFIGDTSLEESSEIKVELNNEKGIQLFERNGKTVGAVLIGDTKERMKITKAIQEKTLYEI